MNATHKIINIPFAPYNWATSKNFGSPVFNGSESDCKSWMDGFLNKDLQNGNEWVNGKRKTCFELVVKETGQVLQRLQIVDISWERTI